MVGLETGKLTHAATHGHYGNTRLMGRARKIYRTSSNCPRTPLAAPGAIRTWNKPGSVTSCEPL